MKLHDLHHIATGYATSLLGEAEISAWEFASGGVGKYPIAVFYLSAAVLMGLFIDPRAVFRAYRQGRSCRNLFRRDFTDDLLELKVGELRELIGIPPSGPASLALPPPN